MTASIYVACLDAYNNGYHHGHWIDLDLDLEEIYKAIHSILKTSPIEHSEEWAIHGYEGFGELELPEYTDLETCIAYAEFFAEYGEDLGSALLNRIGGDLDDARRYLKDAHHGEYDSEEAFAQEMTPELMEIPAHLEFYIDYERLARDLFINDYFSVKVGYMYHIFSHL